MAAKIPLNNVGQELSEDVLDTTNAKKQKLPATSKRKVSLKTRFSRGAGGKTSKRR